MDGWEESGLAERIREQDEEEENEERRRKMKKEDERRWEIRKEQSKQVGICSSPRAIYLKVSTRHGLEGRKRAGIVRKGGKCRLLI